jgi:hypothetical protein
LYAAPNIISAIKARRVMRWTGHIAHMGEINACKILVGNLKGRDHSGDLGVDGRTVLEWIVGK